MSIEARQDGNIAVVALSGRLDGVTSPQYGAKLRELLESGASCVVVDLAELTYISSAGVGEFVQSAKLLKQAGGRFSLANVPARVRSVFDMCGLGAVFEIYSSVADALAA